MTLTQSYEPQRDLLTGMAYHRGSSLVAQRTYTYSPYGEVTANGDDAQPIQWSSEFNDAELGLVYYNYRHYNPADGRWIGRDMLPNQNEYFYSSIPITKFDILGRKEISIEVTKIAHPNIVYVTANDIKKYAGIANILGKIDHGDGSFFATTHGVIKPNHFLLKCKCENKLWKPNYIKVWPSILILINKPRIAKMFHGAPAGLEEFKNFEMSYIPSNDGTKGADPIKILQYEMDHYRDLRAWFNGVGFHDSIGKKIQELTKK